MSKIGIKVPHVFTLATLRWLAGRVGVIYVILFLFCLTCVDFKVLDTRIKIRRLNAAIPDFSAMINFSKHMNDMPVDWRPYKKYFELILRYIPDDVITKQLLGYVYFNMGQEQQAITLFKSSSTVNGQALFWSNYNLGVIYYKKSMWPQAIEYLFKAISSNPHLTILIMQESTVYRQILVCPNFQYSLNDEVNNAQSKAYLLLLSSLHFMKQNDKIIIISNLGIANPSLSYKDAFYYYQGLAFFEEGQLEKAFMLFHKSLTIENKNPDIYYYISSIYQKAGQVQQAREFLQISYLLHQKSDPRFPYETRVNLLFF